MPRSIWKGAISFGLVHIPVSVVSATRPSGLDFDWLDDRSLDPVGYQRINKSTGKEVPSEHIVKGIEHGKGQYVVLSDDEIHGALPEATRTLDILAFVEAREISILYFEKPYYLAPDKHGEKVYALLRDTLSAAGKVGVANLVMHTKQHLAVIMPLGDALVLNTLRWADEVRSAEDVGLEGLGAKVTKKEVEMAQRLVDDMTETWDPAQYHDTFKDNVLALVERKLKDGKLEAVTEAPKDEDSGADVIDLTELLRRSLGSKGKASAKDKTTSRASSGRRSSTASRPRKAK